MNPIPVVPASRFTHDAAARLLVGQASRLPRFTDRLALASPRGVVTWQVSSVDHDQEFAARYRELRPVAGDAAERLERDGYRLRVYD